MSDPRLNTTIDHRYHLTDVIGKGGMGIVYRAADEKLGGRACAVKLLLDSAMSSDEVIRFEREFRIISRLHSDHIVRVLDTGLLEDQRRYLVMELLEGAPLSQILKREGRLRPERAVSMMKGILAGLAEAHSEGVTHRDLKPANVFITRSRAGNETAKVLDFGIAKDTQAVNRNLTAANMLIGTPRYMAPEQFIHKPIDQRTDLYSAGLLFYLMLEGRTPFDFKDPVPESLEDMPSELKIGWLHVNQAPPSLEATYPDLWPIIAKLLAKEPEARFGSAQEVLDILLELDYSGQFPAHTASFYSGPLPANPTGASKLDEASDSSQTTGHPILGETLAATPPRSGKPSALWLALTAAALVVVGLSVYLITRRAPPEDEAALSKKGICVNAIETYPAGATLFMANQPLGLTPFALERPCHEVWMIRIERKGYRLESLKLRGSQPRMTHNLTLSKEMELPPQRPIILDPDAGVEPDAASKPTRRPSPRIREPKPKPKPKKKEEGLYF